MTQTPERLTYAYGAIYDASRVGADDHAIAHMQREVTETHLSPSERDATAATMAKRYNSAPLMLEALRGCLDLLEADESNDEWAREFAKPKAAAARAAICAAEGGADLGVEPVERPVCTCPFASEGYLSKNCALHAPEGPGATR